MVGKYKETAITGYLLDFGISRFTHGERDLAVVDLACLNLSYFLFFFLDNFHGLVVKD
jgi:hypothetical protein